MALCILEQKKIDKKFAENIYKQPLMKYALFVYKVMNVLVHMELNLVSSLWTNYGINLHPHKILLGKLLERIRNIL